MGTVKCTIWDVPIGVCIVDTAGVGDMCCEPVPRTAVASELPVGNIMDDVMGEELRPVSHDVLTLSHPWGVVRENITVVVVVS